MFAATCPHCQRIHQVNEDLQGKKARCGCGTVFTLLLPSLRPGAVSGHGAAVAGNGLPAVANQPRALAKAAPPRPPRKVSVAPTPVTGVSATPATARPATRQNAPMARPPTTAIRTAPRTTPAPIPTAILVGPAVVPPPDSQGESLGRDLAAAFGVVFRVLGLLLGIGLIPLGAFIWYQVQKFEPTPMDIFDSAVLEEAYRLETTPGEVLRARRETYRIGTTVAIVGEVVGVGLIYTTLKWSARTARRRPRRNGVRFAFLTLFAFVVTIVGGFTLYLVSGAVHSIYLIESLRQR